MERDLQLSQMKCGRLAERSGSSAKQISVIIKDSAKQVSDGVAISILAGEKLTEIVEKIRNITEKLEPVTSATQEQAAAMEENTSVTETNASAAQQFGCFVCTDVCTSGES